MTARLYVVQKNWTWLEVRGPCAYPEWMPSIDDATRMSHGKAVVCANAFGGLVVEAPREVRTRVEPEAVATFAPPTLPSGTVPVPFGFSYTFTEDI